MLCLVNTCHRTASDSAIWPQLLSTFRFIFSHASSFLSVPKLVSHTARNLSSSLLPPMTDTCRFFATSSGCFRGSSCKFRHENPSVDGTDGNALPAIVSTPLHGRSTIPCKFFAQGYCLRGQNCAFKHDISSVGGASSSSEGVEENEGEEKEEVICAICFDAPSTFGLLSTFDFGHNLASDFGLEPDLSF